ncbi:MAG: hypothetical protein WAV93_06010 [Bacteroidales bacterium]
MGATVSVRDIMILMPAIFMGLILQVSASSFGHDRGNQQDSAYLKQQLHNGRVWENKYDKVTGHEFFLTEALSAASVTVGDRTFNDQLAWYDLYNDRIVLMVRPGYFIELSGETAERFTFRYLNENYFFRYFGEKGYCQLFHEGRVLLVRKYVKVIKKNAVNGSYDAFEEEATDYLVKDGSFTRLRAGKDLFSVLADREAEVRHFIREHGIRVSPKKPGSIIPVLQFYDSL